jgi:hypothetical protein
MALLEGRGAAQDVPRAISLTQKACDRNDAQSCLLLGLAHSQGRGVELDSKRAVQLYDKACTAGEPNACAMLGSAYARGDGVPRDEGRAAKLFRRACDGGSREGCGSLARAIYFGWGVPQDRAAAGNLYEKAHCLSREEAPPVPADTPQGAWENLRATYARCEYSTFMLAMTARSHDELLGALPFFLGVGMDPHGGGPILGPTEIKEFENLLRRHGLSLKGLGDPKALSRVKDKAVLYGGAQRFFRRHGIGPTVLAYLEPPLEDLQIQGSRATAKIGDFGTVSFEKSGGVWLVDYPRREQVLPQKPKQAYEIPDTLRGGRVPPPSGAWKATGSPPLGAQCWCPLFGWGNMAGRNNPEIPAMVFAMSKEWFEPEDILAVMTEDEAATHVVAGSTRTSEVERGPRKYRARTWLFKANGYKANGELWDGAVYILKNPDRPGSFVFQSCAPHVKGENPARGALLEMMDQFEFVPDAGLKEAIRRGHELKAAIEIWRIILPRNQANERFRKARARSIADLRASPDFGDNSGALLLLGELAAFNDDALLLGPGYDREEVVRALEKASTLGTIGDRAELLAQAYLERGEPQRALDTLRPYLSKEELFENHGKYKGYLTAGDAFRALGDRGRAVSAYRIARGDVLWYLKGRGPETWGSKVLWLSGQAPSRRLPEELRLIEARLTAMGERPDGPTPTRKSLSFDLSKPSAL